MKILSVAGDPGGADALVPVIRALKKNHSVTCWAYRGALEIWKKASFEPAPVQDGALAFDAVLLGTTVSPEKWEQKIISRAKKEGLPTLSVVDFWTQYRERFLDEKGALILPDRIAVMDDKAKADMAAAGFPTEKLFVTGQPVFEELLPYRSAAGAKFNDPIRFLFISQPLSQLYTMSQLGFHESDVLGDLITTLQSILADKQKKGLFKIKKHPREFHLPYIVPKESNSWLKIEIIQEPVRPIDVLREADVVLGMSSILLVSGCFLSKTVISYQPNLSMPDPLVSNTCKWSRAVYSRRDLGNALIEELFDKTAQHNRAQALRSAVPTAGSVNRIIDLLSKDGVRAL